MALIQCRECSGQVSDKAASCPHCGAPLSGRPAPNEKKTQQQAGAVVFVLIVAVVWFLWPSGDGKHVAKATTEDVCKADDLQCLGDKGIVAAGIYCQKDVERIASHSVKWTDGTFEPKFSRFRWKDKPAGIITFVGDKAEFQNGFGAYTPVVYECDIAPDGKTVLNVRAVEGRLPG